MTQYAIVSPIKKKLHYQLPLLFMSSSLQSPKEPKVYKPSERRLKLALTLRAAAELVPNDPPTHVATALIDSGATDSFIDIALVKRLNLPLFPLNEPIPVHLADGATPRSGSITSWTAVNVHTGKTTTTMILYPIQCPRNPLILGYDFLERVNPRIDWRKKILTVRPEEKIPLPTFPTDVPIQRHYLNYSKRISVLTATKFATLRQRSSVGLCVVTVIPEDLPPNAEPRLPKQYESYASVFDDPKPGKLPPRRTCDLKIELEEGKTPPWGPVYRLTQEEEAALKEFVRDLLARGVIRPSMSSCSAPVLFAPKKDGGLRLCVDYRGLNSITKKNRYPLPLIEDVINALSGAKIFTKLDLRDGYHNIRIAEGDEWKTAFRTKQGLFEYTCVPFGLANAPPGFQAFMDSIFGDMVNEGVVIYLDDILVYSKTENDHQRLVTEVLRRLKENNLFARLSKCEFHKSNVEFLGYRISSSGIGMDPGKVKSVVEWPQPQCVKDLQSFLGLANYYRTFISNFAETCVPLTELLRKDKPYVWSAACEKAFSLLKREFQESVVLAFPDHNKPFIVETDASGYALGGILSQEDEKGRTRPVAFYSRKLNAAERNYEVYDQELLAIKCCFDVWSPYLKGAKHRVLVYSDHRNLQWFMTTRQLNRRQVRWSLFFADYDFVIHHRPGSECKPDALSRRPDYRTGEQDVLEKQLLPPKLFAPCPRKTSVASIEILSQTADLEQRIRIEQLRDPDVKQFRVNPLHRPNSWRGRPTWSNRLLLLDNKVYVPEAARLSVMRAFHDHPASGHPGIENTFKSLADHFYWPKMKESVHHYVSTCDACQRNKILRHKPWGLLQPLAIPRRPWSSVSMDFITDLPKARGCTNIAVVVCRRTKMAHFFPLRSLEALPVAESYLRNVIRLHGMPSDIVSDRGSTFTSNFWTALCRLANVDQKLSTTYHPQTDGQTEIVNQQLEQYLRHYVNYSQDNWIDYLPLAEFAHNSRRNASTRLSPFEANYGFQPTIQIPPQLPDEKNPSATAHLRKIRELQGILEENLSRAQARMKHFANQHRQDNPEYQVGDLVMVSTRNMRTRQACKKLAANRIGPFRIIKRVNNVAFKVELPEQLRVHNVFHVSLLEPYNVNQIPNRVTTPPPPVIVDGYEEHEVDSVLDSRVHYRRLQYLVKWSGLPLEQSTWEYVENVANCADLVDAFHQANPHKPGPSEGGRVLRSRRSRR